MPIGICPRCQGRFVIEDERSYQRTCPCCLLPMEVPRVAETPGPLQSRKERAPSVPGDESERRYWDGVPLAADERGHRLLAAIAEAAYLKEQAAACRSEARRLRHAEAAVPVPVRWADPAWPPGPDQGTRGGAVMADPRLRAAELCQRAKVALTHAREVQIEARMICGALRVLREDRHAGDPPEAALPPLDYVLFSEARLPPPFDPANPPAWLAERLTAPTILYVWGYELPESTLCRDQCDSSEAAEQFAARAGWDPRRPGAWAKETTVLQRAGAALRELEPTLRQDGAVVGWGVRMERPH